jgi:hypothetical protein
LRRQFEKCFDVVGLIFNMVGVGILFIWGPPQPSFEGGGGLLLEDANVFADGGTVAQHRADAAVRQVGYKRMSRVGLAFILIGFACQLGGEVAR